MNSEFIVKYERVNSRITVKKKTCFLDSIFSDIKKKKRIDF
jgi:hypothetical protein